MLPPALWPLLLLASESLVLAATIKSPSSVSNHTYDYIVVGGGLAGLTVDFLAPFPASYEYCLIVVIGGEQANRKLCDICARD